MVPMIAGTKDRRPGQQGIASHLLGTGRRYFMRPVRGALG